MNNYTRHALQEFKAAGWTDEDGCLKMNFRKDICEHTLKLLDVFAGAGHSGSSAQYTIDLFKTLASFSPIAPLTGEDWEWSYQDYGGGASYQNKRCSHVFKDTIDGVAYDINGRVFWDWATSENGEQFKSYYTCSESRVAVTFPYTPSVAYEFRQSAS